MGRVGHFNQSNVRIVIPRTMQSLFHDVPKTSSASCSRPSYLAQTNAPHAAIPSPSPTALFISARAGRLPIRTCKLEPDCGSFHCCGCLILTNKAGLIPVVAIPGKEASRQRYHGKSLPSAIDFLSVRRSVHSSRERPKHRML